MKQEYIPVGRIVNAHGTRGEVRLQPDGLTPSFLTRFDTFYLDGQPLRPTANHVHKSFVLLKLPGVDDMNAALALKGKTLSSRRADAPLKEGEYFDQDLLGLQVYHCENGELLGELVAVDSYPFMSMAPTTVFIGLGFFGLDRSIFTGLTQRSWGVP